MLGACLDSPVRIHTAERGHWGAARRIHSVVIGAGFVGRAHVEAVRRLHVPVAGVLASAPARTEEVRRLLGLPRAYPSLAESAVQNSSLSENIICRCNAAPLNAVLIMVPPA